MHAFDQKHCVYEGGGYSAGLSEEEEEEEEDEQVPQRRSPRSRIPATGKSDLRTLMEDEKSITKKKNENKRTKKPCHSRTNQNLPLRRRAISIRL